MSTASSEALINAFRQSPSRETLAGAVYAVLCNCHRGNYLPEEVQAFQLARGIFADCGMTAGALSDVLQPELDSPIKVAVFSFSCPGYQPWSENQFVTIIAAPDPQGGRRFFGVDQAAWFYSLSDPWFHIVEGRSAEEALDALQRYFQEETRPELVLDRAAWRPTSGRARTLKFLDRWFAERPAPVR